MVVIKFSFARLCLLIRMLDSQCCTLNVVTNVGFSMLSPMLHSECCRQWCILSVVTRIVSECCHQYCIGIIVTNVCWILNVVF